LFGEVVGAIDPVSQSRISAFMMMAGSMSSYLGLGRQRHVGDERGGNGMFFDSMHSGNISNFAMADGSVRSLSHEIDIEVFWDYSGINDAGPVSSPD